MSDVLSELVTLAASPALVDVLDEPPHPTFALDDQAIALRAIEAGIDEARTSGTRAAVCVADLTAVDDGTASRGPVLDAADAWLLRHLRPTDRVYWLDGACLVVASGLGHPHDAERLADRVRALPAAGETPLAVGLAIYPTHGDDAVTLLDCARRSARRAATPRGVSETRS